MNGWIKLHRQFLQWEWFSDPNVLSVFVYLLLQANHKDGKWRGHEVLCGQHITSNEIISLHTGLSVQMVRTALRKLKSTGEITTQATNKFTLVTIVKWAFYQGGADDCNTQDNNQSANSQHSDNTQPTNKQHSINNKQELKEKKNRKNVRSEENPLPPTAFEGDSPASYSQPVGFEVENPNKIIRSNYKFHGELEQAVNNWLTYKQEKRQQYKPSGLNSLLSQVQKHAKTYGETAVIHAINESMASNYQGIVWDKAKNIASERDSQQQKGNPFLAYAKGLEEKERGNLS
jgi:hypothetical protein